MKNLAFGVLCMLLLSACNISFSSGEVADLPESTGGTKAQQVEAEAAARRFLGMIDSGDFHGTWDHAGPAIRAQTSEFAWKAMLKATAMTLGGAPERELEGFGFSTKIDPHVPIGEYVLVQFENSAGSVTTTEKLVMQRDQAEWKIIGYFVTKRAEYRPGA